MKPQTKNIVYLVLIVLAVLAAVVLVIVWSVRPGVDSVPAAEPTLFPALVPETQVIYQEVETVVEKEKLVEVEKEFTSQIIQEGLNDMSFLVTSEYWFTEVMDYSSTRQLWGHDIPLTESSYLATYDGVVSAGVDFSAIRVEKNDTLCTITVTLPPAKIQSVTIDHDSLVIYSEKESIANPTGLSEFNTSLSKLEETAEARAIENGLLDRAGENAQRIIRSFLSELVDTRRYAVVFRIAEGGAP